MVEEIILLKAEASKVVDDADDGDELSVRWVERLGTETQICRERSNSSWKRREEGLEGGSGGRRVAN